MKTRKLLVMVSIALVTIIILNSWQLTSAYTSHSKWATNSGSFKYDLSLPTNFHSPTAYGATVWNSVSTSSWSWAINSPTSSSRIRYGWVDGANGFIAETQWWHDSNGNINKIEVEYDSYENWYTGSGSPGSNQYDLRSVAVHELGHALGLNHTQSMPHCPGNSADATMCESVSIGSTYWRSLAGDDRDGVDDLYP